MPTVFRTIQNSFAGGEFSPILNARQDIQKYATGLATMKNFYVKPQGAAVNRPGTHYIAEVKDSSSKVNLLPFVFSESISYVLEFGNLYVRFYRSGGQIVSGSVPYEVVTPYTTSEIFQLKITQSADVLYIVHPNHAPMTLSRTSDTNWTIAVLPFKLGPFAPMDKGSIVMTPSATTGNITITANSSVFTANHVGSLMKLETFVPAQTTHAVLTSSISTDAVYGQGTWLMTTHGTWAGRIFVEKTIDRGATWTALRNFSATSEYNIDTSGTENDEIVGMRARLEFTSGTCNIDLQFEPFVNDGVVKITVYTSPTVVSATVQQDLGITTGTQYWFWGAWNKVRGYPSAVTFYQNRLVLGYTITEPQTLWCSQTGDYVNFGTSYVSEDSDAITTSLVSEKVNAIRSLKSLSKIIAFTAGGYWLIGSGGSSDTFTPSSQSASAEGMFGSADINPIIIGNRIIFVGSKSSVVRDAGYDIQAEAYVANDLTLYSKHLFTSHSIVCWAYAQDPDCILWAVRDDGILLSMTYIKEQQLTAWSHHDTDGQFESVCVVPGDDMDYVYVEVKRTIGGATKRYVEVFASRDTEGTDTLDNRGETYVKYNSSDQYFVDCGLSYNNSVAATVFSGLNHLEGKTVSILADGNVQPQQVVTGGSITLVHPANIVHVGLPYVCDLETLNVDFQAQSGTIQGLKKTIKNAIISVNNTRGTLVGGDFNKMYEYKMRSNEPWGTGISLYTGDLKYTLATGTTTKGRICLRITDPLPCNVMAIILEVSIDG